MPELLVEAAPVGQPRERVLARQRRQLRHGGRIGLLQLVEGLRQLAELVVAFDRRPVVMAFTPAAHDRLGEDLERLADVDVRCDAQGRIAGGRGREPEQQGKQQLVLQLLPHERPRVTDLERPRPYLDQSVAVGDGVAHLAVDDERPGLDGGRDDRTRVVMDRRRDGGIELQDLVGDTPDLVVAHLPERLTREAGTRFGHLLHAGLQPRLERHVVPEPVQDRGDERDQHRHRDDHRQQRVDDGAARARCRLGPGGASRIDRRALERVAHRRQSPVANMAASSSVLTEKSPAPHAPLDACRSLAKSMCSNCRSATKESAALARIWVTGPVLNVTVALPALSSQPSA